ncbi:long-chain acyl-CoA synthetase [Jatrophihabitans sp. GAS493]|uniref:AMP-binding protein n=1 Tax=Jatrophihabitans sp. GAS493 TaxID=1907575 RepID=UPI000BB923BF|nr:AMP-binding protein [Jatrophihabitans sp. GAS493]SOD74663.1 long-chain acyl-CoA synthetase [Jatrophihabitans sp. GAS493]
MADQIGRIVSSAAMRHPELAALKTFDGLVRTYSELDLRSTRLANAILDSGCLPGDRVAVWCDTRPQYLELYFALAKAGLVLVPINSMFTEHEAAYQVRDSGAILLFHSEELEAGAKAVAEAVPAVRTLIPIGDWNASESQFERLVAGGSDVAPPEPDEDDLYIIAYTSGTTGRPKGAMVTHRTLRNTLRQHAHSYRTPQYSTCIYHSNMSFVATVLGLIMGHMYICGTVYMTGRVTPEELLDVIERERGTFTFIPSPWIVPMTELVRAHPEKAATIRTFVHSASKANPADLQRWAAVVGHRFLEGWGMTEVSGALVTVTDIADVVEGNAADDLYSSAGRPVLEAVVRVLDEDGNELPRDGESVGELVVRSSSVVIGYWNRPEESARTFRDGWYHSGDLGSVDAAGYVYVTERRSDLVVTGGMNVYPSEIEACISELDGVREVAVVGIAHERWGQTPIATVVRQPGSAITEEDVIAHCAEYLARYKRPSAVYFIDELPRSASNKVLRRVLRDQFGASA